MSAKKKKTQKKTACIPEFDGIYNEIMDSYALLYVGYEMVLKEDDEHGYATVLLHHAVSLLKKASIRLDEANSKLLRFCEDNGFEQAQEKGDES
jgi:hypothetical protein